MVQPMFIPFRHALVEDLDRGSVLVQDGDDWSLEDQFVLASGIATNSTIPQTSPLLHIGYLQT